MKKSKTHVLQVRVRFDDPVTESAAKNIFNVELKGWECWTFNGNRMTVKNLVKQVNHEKQS